MDSQQQQVYEYSQQTDATEQHAKAPQQVATQTATTSISASKNPMSLTAPSHKSCHTIWEDGSLSELLVDFDNLKRNNVDLTEELEKQGWGNYSKRLYGLVYTFLAKEFWIFADCVDHCIISYVLGVKMVIIEKSIAKLLDMEKTGGRRIYNINPREKYMSQEISPIIFKQNDEGNSSKNKELEEYSASN